MRTVSMIVAWGCITAVAAHASAQASRAPNDAAQVGTAPAQEPVDTTRLDVERLPPEAIDVTRDMYDHGFFAEAAVGGRGFLAGVGRLSHPGLFASLGFGYEIFRWLLVLVSAEGSIHETQAPPPPGPTAFEILGVTASLRVSINATPRFAIWLGGDAGIVSSTGDVLRMYGVQQANAIGLAYGGSLGLDWHQLDTHHSIGIMGGARLYPSLQGIVPEQVLGVHGAFYIRYVF